MTRQPWILSRTMNCPDYLKVATTLIYVLPYCVTAKRLLSVDLRGRRRVTCTDEPGSNGGGG